MDRNLLEKLNEAQTEAVTHTGGPLMIIAGAGTGKTTVITQRIAWLIEQAHADPENILALTFTEKAAEEMEERVDRLLPYGYVDLQINTFHGFCEHLLRQYGAEIGLPRNFTIASEVDAWLIARQHLDEFDLDYYKPLGQPAKHIRSLLIHFSRLKDEAITPDDYLDFVEEKRADLDTKHADEDATVEIQRLTELANAYHTYQQVLLKNDAVDFGDLLMYVLKLLDERPHVRKEICERYSHVLVDEFQDTNFAQYAIVKRVAAPDNELTVVGDDDQSIYKFRGASLANILQFQNDYPDTKKIVLTKNYRSVQAILDRAYAFIQANNPNRLESQDEALDKELRSEKEQHGIVEHMHVQTAEQETDGVAQRILQLKKEHPDASWSDFAILARSNNSASSFLSALDRHGIPYHFVALQGLYKKTIILDALAYLRVIDNPYDSPSLYRVLSHDMYDLDPREIARINHFANKKGKALVQTLESIHEIDGLAQETIKVIDELLSTLRTLRTKAQKRPSSEILLETAQETGLVEYVKNQSERNQRENFNFLQQFYERMKRFDTHCDQPTLKRFLDEFEHERRAGEEGALSHDLQSGPDMVRVMTVHASKGLEFRFVFLVHLVNRRFPTTKRRDPIPVPDGLVQEQLPDGDWHTEEERRLFYVGMTRAKQGVIFTSAEDYGGSRTKKLSKFLHELGYEKASAGNEASQKNNPFLDKKTPETPGHPDEIVYELPKYFSFTQLKAFDTCPLQYKFAHILNVPVFGNHHMSFGKTMHNTLHEFFVHWMERVDQKQGQLFDTGESPDGAFPVALDELLNLYEENWLDEWYQSDAQREKYREQGRQSLKEYYKQLDEEQPQPLHLEQGFKLKIGEITIKGRIDRIDKCEGGVEIIDYKTGKPKTKKELRKGQKEQLYIYQMAARDVLDLEPKKLSFHYLRDNSRVSFLGSEDELLDLREEITDRVHRIKDSKFDADPGWHCKYCDFKDICDFSEA